MGFSLSLQFIFTFGTNSCLFCLHPSPVTGESMHQICKAMTIYELRTKSHPKTKKKNSF